MGFAVSSGRGRGSHLKHPEKNVKAPWSQLLQEPWGPADSPGEPPPLEESSMVTDKMPDFSGPGTCWPFMVWKEAGWGAYAASSQWPPPCPTIFMAFDEYRVLPRPRFPCRGCGSDCRRPNPSPPGLPSVCLHDRGEQSRQRGADSPGEEVERKE